MHEARRNLVLSRRAFLAAATATSLLACAPSESPSGKSFAGWGSQGLRDGDFLKPRAIAWHEARVYVIDTTGRVQVFDENGSFLSLWKTPDASNGTPTAIAVGRDGRLLVPDTHYHQILEYSTDGDLLAQWGAYGTAPDQFIYPTGIAQHADGRFFISEYGEDAERIHVFGPDRIFLTQWGAHGFEPGQFNRAMSVALDGDRLHVADTTNHRIQSFALDGKLLGVTGSAGSAAGQLRFPFAIALAPNGTIAAAEYGNNRVSLFSGEGAFLGAYGSAGRAPGTFNEPRGIAVSPDGIIFVADTHNHRVQRFPLELLT